MNIFNQYSEKYDEWYDKHKFAYLSELEALKKVIPKASKGLEIGVGTGRFAAELNIATGIDPSEKMIEIARKRGVNVQLGHGESLPFSERSFDYVVIIIAICFVKDPLKVLKEARRVIKEKGHLIIGIIDKDSSLGKFYQKKKSVFYKKAHFFTIKEIRNFLKESGFSKFLFYQTLFTLPDRMTSVEKPKKGFGHGGFLVIRAGK